jgi:hypothetical protein
MVIEAVSEDAVSSAVVLPPENAAAEDWE